jgi:hypothetical protein
MGVVKVCNKPDTALDVDVVVQSFYFNSWRANHSTRIGESNLLQGAKTTVEKNVKCNGRFRRGVTFYTVFYIVTCEATHCSRYVQRGRTYVGVACRPLSPGALCTIFKCYPQIHPFAELAGIVSRPALIF